MMTSQMIYIKSWRKIRKQWMVLSLDPFTSSSGVSKKRQLASKTSEECAGIRRWSSNASSYNTNHKVLMRCFVIWGVFYFPQSAHFETILSVSSLKPVFQLLLTPNFWVQWTCHHARSRKSWLFLSLMKCMSVRIWYLRRELESLLGSPPWVHVSM